MNNRCTLLTKLISATLSSKSGSKKNKMATGKMQTSSLQSGTPQTNGWRHGDLVHLYSLVSVCTLLYLAWENLHSSNSLPEMESHLSDALVSPNPQILFSYTVVK